MIEELNLILQDPTLTTLMVVTLVSLVGIILIMVWMFRSGPLSKKQKRLDEIVSSEGDGDVQSAKQQSLQQEFEKSLGSFRELLNESLGQLSSEKLQLKLSSVYWEVTDTEFILIRFISPIVAFILGWIIPGNILGGIFLAVLAYMAPPFILDRAVANRQKKFQEQLLDVLVLIKGSVQAGYGFMQALDLAAKEVPNPASEEFGRVLYEINLGLSLEDALLNFSERMDNDDLQIVVTAIIINSQVGGDLSTILEESIATIRDRMHLMGEIRSLTAYSRYVGYFLTALPFLTGGVIFIFSPDYFETVKTSLLVQVIFGAAFVGIIIGNIWISKIVQVKV